MNTEEQYIREQMGTSNPFRVPEGYFDSLTAQVMERLPEPSGRSRVVRMWRPWMSAAAGLLVAAISTAVYFTSLSPSADELHAQAAVADTDTYMDDAADYVMLDNAEIYACLADY